MNYLSEQIPTQLISLLGYSGCGKSSVVERLTADFDHDSIASAIVKKDDAIRRLATERFGEGNEWRGYTAFRGFNEADIHKSMNAQILSLIGEVDVVFLEGGTRTPKSIAETLAGGIDPDILTIIKFEVSPITIAKRLIRRRHEDDRTDDRLPLMLGKLAGQAVKNIRHGDELESDPRLKTIDAELPLDLVVGQVREIIDYKLADRA